MGAALGIIAGLVPVIRGNLSVRDPLGKLSLSASPEAVEEEPFEGLDLMRLELRPRRTLAPLADGRVAELTVDPVLQRAAVAQMKRYRVPEAGAVMIRVGTGEVLVYASHVQQGEPFDVNARAEAPAASVFKLVTGATLVERGGLNRATEQCYRGGRSRILADELQDDPARDQWCATLAMAMGRSLNVVFARLAQKHITPEDLTAMGGALGFGAEVPFPVANEAPKIDIPGEPLEFARSAAGFWHTSLSPLAAASLAQTIANRGVTLKPRIVGRVLEGEQETWRDDDGPVTLRRAIKPKTAEELTAMMVETVASGSAFKTFHDPKRRPFLPGIEVAGKTGTLTRREGNRHYTWFVGFAPANKPEVAVAALVVNTPIWRIKGPLLARNLLRAYFAQAGRPGVSAP